MSDIREVVILMGGASSERAVSLVSGRAVMEAIDTTRFHARAVDFQLAGRSVGVQAAAASTSVMDTAGACLEPAASGLAEQILQGPAAPDVVFIALHGRYGEDGCVQGLLEMLGVPYTGSGVLASALAMDKVASKRIMESEGIPTPRWTTARRGDNAAEVLERVRNSCGFPCIVKPNREGSTIGATIVRQPEDVADAVAEALRHDALALIEELVGGIEVTVGILDGEDGPQALPVVEICPASGFYDYEAKYTAGAAEKIVPARLPEDTTEEVLSLALQTHVALGCIGMSRVDLFVTPAGSTVLEANTIPGMTPTSLLPRAAQAAGISFTELITRIIESGIREGVR